jgi:hypothetical protein
VRPGCRRVPALRQTDGQDRGKRGYSFSSSSSVFAFGEHHARFVATALRREQPRETHRRAQRSAQCAHASINPRIAT